MPVFQIRVNKTHNPSATNLHQNQTLFQQIPQSKYALKKLQLNQPKQPPTYRCQRSNALTPIHKTTTSNSNVLEFPEPKPNKSQNPPPENTLPSKKKNQFFYRNSTENPQIKTHLHCKFSPRSMPARESIPSRALKIKDFHYVPLWKSAPNSNSIKNVV